MGRLTTLVFVLMCAFPTSAQLQVVNIQRGRAAETVDRTVQNRIEKTLKENWPLWQLSPRRITSHNNEEVSYTNADQTINLTTSYYLTTEDAAHELQFELMMIQMPRYKRLPSTGDEAYTMLADDGPILLRCKNVVIRIHNDPKTLDAAKEAALMITLAIRADS